MDNVKIFNNEEFGSIRTLTINGEPWFVGKDIAEKLEYQNGSRDIERHTDDDDRKIIPLFDGTQNRNTIVINESGVYSLILSSKMPNAKRFKHWVTSEVLPSIRKYEVYMTDNMLTKSIEDPDYIIGILTAYKQEKQEKERLQKENQTLIITNEKMKPKAEYYDNIVDRQLNLNFRDTAKEIGVKVNVFMNTLREKKYIYKDRYGNNKPYSKYINNEDINKNLFVIKECCSSRYQGNQTLITPSGRNYFRQMFSEQN